MNLTPPQASPLRRLFEGQTVPAAQAPARGMATATNPVGLVADTLTLSPTATARRTPPLLTVPTFGYVTRHAHTVEALASQFGTTPAMLMQLNGWTSPDQMVPAGTTIRVADTPEARSLAQGYGGRLIETRPASPASPGSNRGSTRVPYISQRTPDGRGADWTGSYHCGATVLAMVMRAAGMDPNLSDAALIEKAMKEASTAPGGGTGPWNLHVAAERLFAPSSYVEHAASNIDALDAALEQGKVVAANGNYAQLHGKTDFYSPHWVLIVGRTADGDYLVHDPDQPNGGEPLVVTREELLAYFDHHRTQDGSKTGGYFVTMTP